MSKLIEYESYPASQTDDTLEILNFVLAYCSELGFETKKVNDFLGWTQLGEEGVLIAFPIHLDVVPPGEGWSLDPFKLTKKGSYLYGRGTYDNKGPAAIMITLLNEIKNKVNLGKMRIRLIFGTKEETGMDCIKRYTETEEMPEAGFVPDAMFPAVVGEKARIHLKLKRKEKVEWMDKFIGGTEVNSVPDKCILIKNINDKNVIKASISKISENNFRIISHGAAAHGSKPATGSNAILNLLVNLKEEYQSVCIKDILKISSKKLNGKKIGINSLDDKFGDTSVNLGICNYEREEWNLELDIRFGRNISKKKIIKQLSKEFSNWDISIINFKDLHIVKEDDPILKELASIFYNHCPGESQEYIYMGGGTYASYFPDFVSFGPKFKNKRTFAHSADEKIEIEYLEKTINIYKDAIEMLIERANNNEI